MTRLPGLLSKTTSTLREGGPRALLTKIRSRIYFFLNTARVTLIIRSAAGTSMDIEESLDFAFGLSKGEVTIKPVQVRSEITGLLQILANDPPKRVLEIGTGRGGTLFLLSRVARSEAVLASVDLPGGAFGATYRAESNVLLRALARSGQTLRIIRADSHSPATLARVQHVFDNHPIDLLLIDGDHRYEGVRADFAMYSPLVRPGGRIVFHDIVPASAEHVGGVPQFWEEVKHLNGSQELVHAWDQPGFGIGVIQVPVDGLPTSLLTR
jgi:predicted O-methyltransferase YrrM